LRHEIRESTIRRGGVHIVSDGETEVSGPAAITEATLENVNARAEELDDGEGQIGEVVGIGSSAFRQKFAE
jgi:hypothetical protein